MNVGAAVEASAPAAPRSVVARFADRVAARRGRRRYGLAFFLGVLAAIALPPFYATPLILPAFTGLLWLYDGVKTRRAAIYLGWWFGFGFYLCGLYWVAISMTVDLAQFGWMIPFALFGLSGGLALFAAATLWLLKFCRMQGAGRIFALAAAWTALEWVRGHILTGFPWNLIGYSWTVADAPIQFASVVGSYGLSLVTVVIAALPAALGGTGAARRPWLPLGAAILLTAALWGGGALRLAGAGDAMVPGVTLRLVQPDIAQTTKWRAARIRENLAKTVALSIGPGYDRVTDIVWPETSIGPFYLADEPDLRATLARIVPRGGLLLTGTLRREAGAEGPPAAAVPGALAPVRVFNSLEALDDQGRVVAAYDKYHLVPFGEYVPLRGILPIEKLTGGIGDFSAGPGPRTLSLPHLPPVSPLICYEAIFPGAVADRAHPPRWLLNVTNDAWFGNSSGPYQHFESARLRAVEEGVPLIRAANTGISGIIDPYGRVLKSLGLGKAGIVDGPLPQALALPTWFVRGGDLGFLILLALSLLLAWRLARVG